MKGRKRGSMKTVIIGGVAGGASAAARLRRLDEKAQIIVLEKTGFVSYANCGLPYYVGGTIEEKEALTLQSPQGFRKRFAIDVRVKNEVTAIDPVQKKVAVKDLVAGTEYEESYDRLILAPGAKPVLPPIPGINSEKIFTIRTVEDTLRIREYAKEHADGTAVIVGGGFIGIEMAENLAQLGMKVTIVEMLDQLMGPFDYDMAAFIHAVMRQNGIDLKLGTAVQGFQERDGRIHVQVSRKSQSAETSVQRQPEASEEPNVQSLPADLVILAIGVVPDTALVKDTGMELGIRGSIVVNDRMQTSIPDIYAVGDAVQVRHMVTGQDALISLAGPANKQGRIAADNICGIESHYKGSLGSSVIKLFQMTAACTGINERTAKTAGIPYESVVLAPGSHAGYYPGAKTMTMKVLFRPEDGKILGAQIVGYDGVDKRIDVLAAAIFAGMTADQLKDLDLSYAPPYSSAKDPVNMAGFVIDNILSGRIRQFHWDQIPALAENPEITRIDARTEGEYARGHVDGFVNIPVDKIREHLTEIDPSKPVYIMCQSGIRSYIACSILSGYGYECFNFSGGYRFYEAVTKEKMLSASSWPCGMDK